MSGQEALRQRFIDRAKALSEKHEVFRCQGVTELIRDAMAFGVPAESEIFEAAYGDPGGRKYWDAILSEPTAVDSLARLLSVHTAENAQHLEYGEIAILRALRDAAESGEISFIGDTAPLLADENDPTRFNGLLKVKVHPRAVAEWLLNRPMREHLVPDSLAQYLHPSAQETAGEPLTELRQATEGIVHPSAQETAGEPPTELRQATEGIVHPSAQETAGEPPTELPQATKGIVHAAIKAVYDAACADRTKPPNIRELPAAVLPLLKDKGYRASKRFIQTIGESQEFKARRRPTGATVYNEWRASLKK
jgi:hypothetical protein